MYHLIRDSRQGDTVIKQNAVGDLEYLTFPTIEGIPFVKHLFTTRTGGVSKEHLASMNLSFSRGDDPENVRENYRRICKILDADITDVVASVQTHTTNIRLVGEADMGKGVVRDTDFADVDGLVTDRPGVVLACFFADCVPLYFVDPVKKVIGLAHSGWRGTIARMGACMVETLVQQFGSNPKDLVVAVGPSICRDCYEVSEDVAIQFAEAFPDGKVVTPGKAEGKYQLDLWLANLLVLTQAGVAKENISVTDVCTCHNPDYLFSHRASNGKRGNLAAFLMMNKECE